MWLAHVFIHLAAAVGSQPASQRTEVVAELLSFCSQRTTVVSCQRNGVHCARTLRREAAGIRIDDDDYGGAAAVAVESIKSRSQ